MGVHILFSLFLKSGESEITHFDLDSALAENSIDQDVVRFDVAVQNFEFSQRFHRLEYVLENLKSVLEIIGLLLLYNFAQGFPIQFSHNVNHIIVSVETNEF